MLVVVEESEDKKGPNSSWNTEFFSWFFPEGGGRYRHTTLTVILPCCKRICMFSKD
jgi:hypothetical protein